MVGLFKKNEWIDDAIPELRGSAGGIHVVVRSLPIRFDAKTGKRIYAYDDFGIEFIEELSYKQLANFDQLRQTLAFGASKTVSIKLRDLPVFTVEIKGTISSNARQFYSDLADALIEAFETKGLKP